MVFLLGIIYLAFISLGLPNALLGAAWPNMYPQFQVPVSYAGAISMIIAFGTIISSLQSDRLTKRFGTGVVTTVSVGITAFALWGFSVSHNFIQLSSDAVLFLLLCCRTDRYALGEQLSESGKRGCCSDGCFLCRTILYRDYCWSWN